MGCSWIGRFVALIILLVAAGDVSAEHSAQSDAVTDHTVLGADAHGGVYIEYMAADGSTYMWYQGEAEVLVGLWRADPAGQICFAYPDYRFDHAAWLEPGAWFCNARDDYFRRAIAKLEDDPFNLRSGVAPFVMRRGEWFADFDAIFAQIAAGRR